jgi:hypothetical protein
VTGWLQVACIVTTLRHLSTRQDGRVDTPTVVAELADRLRSSGFVTGLLVGGSLATGDYRAGVSDIDLVAVIERTVDTDLRSTITTIHQSLEARTAAGANLGCAYVATSALSDPASRHPTWTHGHLVERPLSGIARAELVRYGFAVFGHPPATGELITKTSAIDEVQAPDWLRADLRVRRSGKIARSPRLRTAWLAWSDARRTTAAVRRSPSP